MYEVNDQTTPKLNHRAERPLLRQIDRPNHSSLLVGASFQSGDELLACRDEYLNDPLSHRE